MVSTIRSQIYLNKPAAQSCRFVLSLCDHLVDTRHYSFKGYLRYKTITSQNVPSKAEENYALFSRYSRFCIFNHPMNYKICDVMVSIRTWNRIHFWIYLLNLNSITRQTCSIDRYKQRQYFSKIFRGIWRTGAKFQALFTLATCCNYSITNYIKFPVIHILKCWIRDN